MSPGRCTRRSQWEASTQDVEVALLRAGQVLCCPGHLESCPDCGAALANGKGQGTPGPKDASGD